MKKITLESEIQVFEEISELNSIQRELLLDAKAAALDAYAPYSNFRVGAAVLLDNGKVVIGSNQENAAYPLTLCGERNAMFAAAAQYPNAKFEKVAITVNTDGEKIDRPVPPCGSCRQVIYEYETRYSKDIEIILQGDKGDIYVVGTVKDILPLLFDSSYL